MVSSHKAPASQPPPSGGALIGQLCVSFVGSSLALAVDMGLPLTEAQKADILTCLVTGWAFASAIAVVWRSARHRVQSTPDP